MLSPHSNEKGRSALLHRIPSARTAEATNPHASSVDEDDDDSLSRASVDSFEAQNVQLHTEDSATRLLAGSTEKDATKASSPILAKWRKCLWIVVICLGTLLLLLSGGGTWLYRTAPPDGMSPPWYPTREFRPRTAFLARLLAKAAFNSSWRNGPRMARCVSKSCSAGEKNELSGESEYHYVRANGQSLSDFVALRVAGAPGG